jgi:glyoxylase-like metal-dependent hydrolase (beta-lactamase superfamily II)
MSIRRIGLACLLAISASLACAKGPSPAPTRATPLAADVYIEPIAPDLWRHVSYWRFPGIGYYASNGLIIRGREGVLIVDTAWDDSQTSRVFDWVEANVGEIRALVVTHAHNDRLGGIAEANRREIPSYASKGTVELAAEQGWPAIGHALSLPFSLDALGVDGEVYHPGPAHTVDNVTVWLREPRVLVGGCPVRAAEVTSMGNTEEADLKGWPIAIRALQVRYPNVRIVLPGHGDPGGPELLTHTLELLEQ